MAKIDNSIQKLVKGMNTDFSVLDQPEGTYRYMLNGVNQSDVGDLNLRVTEQGNELFQSMKLNIKPPEYTQTPISFIIIGSIYIGDNQHAIFGIDYDEENSFIGTMNSSEGINIFLYDKGNTCLQFNVNNQITGEYRLRNGCEKTVYWVDGINAVKTINFSENYNSDAYNTWLAAYNAWKEDPLNQPPTYVDNDLSEHCLKLKLIKHSETFPTFDSIEIEKGGQLKSGTYNFAIKYVDENGNDTPWLAVSQLIAIYNSNEDGTYDGVMGSTNVIDGDNDITNQIFGTYPSNKSIKLTLGNLNEAYVYYRIAVLQATSGIGKVTKVLESANQLTKNNIFIHDGNESRYTESTIEEIIPDIPNIGIAKHIAQIEDRLILANTESDKKQYCSLQKYASKITTQYVVQDVETYKIKELGDPKNPQSYFEKVSYMGGEVYAFGIVWIFKDGIQSPVYHIPGRPATSGERDNVNSPTIDPNAAHIGTGDVEKWRVYDTSSSPVNNKGNMAFWEMQVGEYDAREYPDYWGYDSRGINYPLETQKIRHHKFPGRIRVPHHDSIVNDFPEISKIDVEIQVSPHGTPPTENVAYLIEYTTEDEGGTPTTATIGEDIDFSIFADYGIYRKTLTVNNKITNVIFAETYTGAVSNPIWGTTKNYDVNCGINNTNGTGGGNNYEVYINAAAVEITSGFGVTKLLGIEFGDIELPDDVVGYKIVRAKRDDFNRTVLTKGFSGLTRQNDDFLAFVNINEPWPREGEFAHEDFDLYTKFLISPESVFENKNPQGTFTKLERIYQKENIIQGFTTDVVQDVNDESTGWLDSDGYDWVGTCRVNEYATTEYPTTEDNFEIKGTDYLPLITGKVGYTTNEGATKKLYNCSTGSKVGFLKHDREYTSDDTLPDRPTKYLYYVSVNINKDVHPLLDNIEYYQTKNNIQTEESDINFGGDTFISHFYLTNGTYQGYNKGVRPVDFIAKVVIIVVTILLSVVLTVFTGVGGVLLAVTVAALLISGAASIVLAGYQEFIEDYENTTLDEVVYDPSVDHEKNPHDDTYYNSLEHGYGMFVESDINVALRQDLVQGFSGVMTSHSPAAARQYAVNTFLMWDKEKNKNIYFIIAKPEVYKVNKDYNRINDAKVWFSLPATYECVSDCLEKFPNRIYYSEKSFLEERFDSFSKFKQLNYTTIPGEHGEITNIFTIKNAFFAHTKSNLWFIPENIQERVTGDVVSLVGTGGFFGATARKIVDSTVGSAGSVQKFATLKTPMGVFFIDHIEGVVYLLNFSSQGGTKLERISDNGMSKWFKNNTTLTLENQILEAKGKSVIISQSPASPGGTGYHSTFDYENKRFILTKKDLVMSESSLASLKFVNDDRFVDKGPFYPITYINAPYGNYHLFLYNQADDKFYYAMVVSGSGDPGLVKVFELKNIGTKQGWTMSYSDGWTSFHDYIPELYIHDNQSFYSVLNATDKFEMWKHNSKGKYLDFYGEQKQHILDIVGLKNPLVPKIHDNIILQTIATKEDVEQRYVTFNKIVIYNSRQSTGEQILKVVDAVEEADYMMAAVENKPGELILKKLEKDWRINGFRDMVIDYTKSLFLKTTSGKVVNDDVINLEKDWDQLEKFKDKYLRIRLIFDNKNDIKLITNFVIESEQVINE